MRLRTLFVIALWASLAAGATQLLDGRVAHAGIAAGAVVTAVLFARAVIAVRMRWRRVRSWRRPGEAELLPAGPRRVLLVDTGLAGPR